MHISLGEIEANVLWQPLKSNDFTRRVVSLSEIIYLLYAWPTEAVEHVNALRKPLRHRPIFSTAGRQLPPGQA